MKHENVSPLLTWAKPVRNGTFLIDQGTHSWASVYWLSHSLALVSYRTRNNFAAWERLDIRTGQRHRETAFGSALAWRPNARRDGSFSVVAASSDGRKLLGFRECERFEDSTYAVVGPGGTEQRWSVGDELDCAELIWLPDSSGWFSTWHGSSNTHDGTTTLWRFRLGQRHPQRCRLRGLPPLFTDGGWNGEILGITPSGEAIITYGQITHTVNAQTIAAPLYAVRIEDGAHARRLGVLRIPVPEAPSLRGSGVTNYLSDIQLSPGGDRLLLLSEHFSNDRGETTGLYVCGLDGRNFRAIGHIPIHKPTPGVWDGISLHGLHWHPDNRHVSFFYGGFEDRRLYLADTPL